MHIVRIIGVWCLLLGMPTAAMADVVWLRNGDTLTGTFVNVRGKNLTLLTEMVGSVNIPVAQIASVYIVSRVSALVHGQMPVIGTLSLEPGGRWKVTNEVGAFWMLPVATIEVILPADRYSSIVGHRARLSQDWTGTADLGYSVQRGTQQTNTFSSNLDAKRERPIAPIFEPHARTNAHMTMLLSNAADAGASIGANTFSASVRQDFLFATDNFVFGIMQFEHVGAEGLTLRQTYGGGSGYDAIVTSRTTLSLLGGLTLVREGFSTGDGQSTAQLLTGLKLKFQITPRMRLDHTTNAYPNLTNLGQYHFDTRSSIDLKLTNRFSLNTGVLDLYLSNPTLEGQRNSFSLTTGIATTF
jgi:putative salt-induced outer membrane protein YdiY